MINALTPSQPWATRRSRLPNLDRLARRGTSFTNAYNMGAWGGAVCVASRTMLNTGRFVWRAKAAKLGEVMNNGQSWSQMMGAAGYETYMTGKWHVGGLKPAKVFDHVVHVRPGMPNQTEAGYLRPIPGKTDPWSPYDPKFEGFWKGGKHWSEVLADDAEDYIQQAAAKDKPFFMYLAFNAPHDPRQAPREFVEMYPRDQVKIPPNFLPQYPFKQEMQCYQVGTKKDGSPSYLRDERLAPWPRTEFAIQVQRQEYFAIISHMDHQIGRILDQLEASGKMDNTYIFFTADHGLACGQHGLLGKQNMYEHSMKPPLIVAGPGIPAAAQREAPVYLQDIMPTALELAGTRKPKFVEFNSLLPLINDADRPSPYPSIYGCYLKNAQRMIRIGDWKLIVYPQANAVRLYDLANDPLEIHDVAGDPQHASRIVEMIAQLIQLGQEMDDPMDLETIRQLGGRAGPGPDSKTRGG